MGCSPRKENNKELDDDFSYMNDIQISDRVQRRNVLDEIFNAFQCLIISIYDGIFSNGLAFASQLFAQHHLTSLDTNNL
jgi:hypothetical protein